MTQQNKEDFSRLLLAACERVAKRENRKSAKGELKPYSSYRLAKEVKINSAHAYRILRGETIPSRDLLLRVCKVLGCSHKEVVEIFNQTEYRVPSDEEMEEASAHAA